MIGGAGKSKFYRAEVWKEAGFLCCSLEAKCLLLRETSVFVLKVLN